METSSSTVDGSRSFMETSSSTVETSRSRVETSPAVLARAGFGYTDPMTDSERKSPPSSPPPESDRRGGERLLACFPAYVERPGGGTSMALIRDLSTSGAQLLVRGKLDIGERVKIQLFLTEKLDEPRSTGGFVTRVEPLADDEVGMWARRVGVQFDEPLTIYAAEIETLKERERRFKAIDEGAQGSAGTKPD
jgi:hypothetical protein